MRVAALPLFLLVSFVPATSRAANTCPWFTQGSAEHALGGSVSAAVKASESGEGSCTFSRGESASENTLKIVVQKAAPPPCPADSPKLKGIGNEAAICTVKRSRDELVEMIVSRVRELHFTITINMRGGPSQVLDPAHAEDALKQAAEQVAGNLF